MNYLSVHTDISNMLVLRVAVGLPVRESLKPDGTILLDRKFLTLDAAKFT